MVSDWLQKSMHSWLHTQCPLCRLPLNNLARHGICHACQIWYQPIPRCQRCGLATVVSVEQCGQCLSTPPLWNHLYCVGDYQFPLSETIHQLKHHRHFWQAKPLASRLSERIPTPAPVITSVPLHWKRHLVRGFNQSDLIAKQISSELNIRYEAQLFSRIRHTQTQQFLTKAQRRQNLTNAFKLNFIPETQHIAIVDDVVTTGSTVHHLCQLLLEVGIKRIDIYCICRTPDRKELT